MGQGRRCLPSDPSDMFDVHCPQCPSMRGGRTGYVVETTDLWSVDHMVSGTLQQVFRG